MKPKMKKNPNYCRYSQDDEGNDHSGLGFDKKNMHRRERRVFNPGNIKKYYTELVEPALKEEEKEDLEYERQYQQQRDDSESDSAECDNDD